MKQRRIDEIVLAYFPDEGEFSDDHRRLARIACENVERESRQEAVSMAYDLANNLANSPRQNDS